MKTKVFDEKVIWRLNEHIRFRRLFDEGVLIHQERAEALVLNDTGVAFLELCDGKRSTGQIIQQLVRLYGVGEHTLRSDLKGFVEELSRDEIIQEVVADR